MYIGQIKDFWEVSFTHKGTAVPFEPQSKEDCVGFWQWRSIFDDALDVNYTLAKETFVGDVSVDITEASVSKIEIHRNREKRICRPSKAKIRRLS